MVIPNHNVTQTLFKIGQPIIAESSESHKMPLILSTPTHVICVNHSIFPVFPYLLLALPLRLLNIPTRAQESEFITAARPPCLYTCICYYSRVAMGSIDYFKSIPQVLKHTHTLLHVQYTTYINYRKNSIKTARSCKIGLIDLKTEKTRICFSITENTTP